MKKAADDRAGAYLQPVLIMLALLALAGALARIALGGVQNIDETTLKYLGVAGALLLLRDVKSLAFGDYKVEFARKLESLETRVDDTQAAAMGGSPPPALIERAAAPPSAPVLRSGAETAQEGAPLRVPDAASGDPWKGEFGGEARRNDRALEAEVVPSGQPGLFRVRLSVRSTDPRRRPLEGSVQFFLHPTFRVQTPVVTVSPSGVAELTLVAWGAFTVGAVTDGGSTRLELDLAELPGAPREFRER